MREGCCGWTVGEVDRGIDVGWRRDGLGLVHTYTPTSIDKPLRGVFAGLSKGRSAD